MHSHNSSIILFHIFDVDSILIFPIGFLLNLNTLVKVVLVFMSENCYIIVIWSVFGIGSVFVEIFSQFLSSVADINITMYFTTCCNIIFHLPPIPWKICTHKKSQLSKLLIFAFVKQPKNKFCKICENLYIQKLLHLR